MKSNLTSNMAKQIHMVKKILAFRTESGQFSLLKKNEKKNVRKKK